MKRVLLTQWLGRALDPRAYGDSLSKLTQFDQKRKKDGVERLGGNEEREKREDREREKREREKKGVENTIEEEEEHHRLPLLVV